MVLCVGYKKSIHEQAPINKHIFDRREKDRPTLRRSLIVILKKIRITSFEKTGKIEPSGSLKDDPLGSEYRVISNPQPNHHSLSQK